MIISFLKTYNCKQISDYNSEISTWDPIIISIRKKYLNHTVCKLFNWIKILYII